GRTGGKIELRETRTANAGGAALAAHGDEHGLRASGGDTRGSGIQEARHAADRDSCAGAGIGIEEINALRAEIGDDELRSIRREGKAAHCRVRRRTARRIDSGGMKLRGCQIKDVDVVRVAEVQPLALPVVENKFV